LIARNRVLGAAGSPADSLRGAVRPDTPSHTDGSSVRLRGKGPVFSVSRDHPRNRAGKKRTDQNWCRARRPPRPDCRVRQQSATDLRPVRCIDCDRFATGFRRRAGRQARFLRL